MAKPNYSFQKRQKELKRQKKQEEKRMRKLNKATTENTDIPALTPQEVKPTLP